MTFAGEAVEGGSLLLRLTYKEPTRTSSLARFTAALQTKEIIQKLKEFIIILIFCDIIVEGIIIPFRRRFIFKFGTPTTFSIAEVDEPK